MLAPPRRPLILLAIAAILAAVSLARGSAQTLPPPAGPSLSISPRVGDRTTPHDVTLEGFPDGSTPTLVLFDPSGNQALYQENIGASGGTAFRLEPPAGGWKLGLYRIAVNADDHSSMNATFVAGDGAPYLYAMKDPFSPTSALAVVGTDLPAATILRVILTLSNDRGDQLFTVRTDADGVFELYVWPQETGRTFFETGLYRATLPDLPLTVTFTLREEPIGPLMTVDGNVQAGGEAAVHLQRYAPNHFVWAVYADQSGTVQGSFLFGPTDIAGRRDGMLPLPDLPGGQYLLATPYDWGETAFSVAPAPSTDTPTPTMTPTATATATPTPKPTSTSKKATCKKKKRKSCKKQHKP